MSPSRLTSFFLVLSSYTYAQTQSPSAAIQGIWQNSDFGYQMTLMLNADGTGEFDGEVIRYAIQGNRLTMMIDGQSITYTYGLSGENLNLSGGDLDASITFSKAGGAHQEIASMPPSPPQPPSDPPTPSANSGSLLGVWSGNGETIEFKNNGQCAYLGNTFYYQSTPSQITLQTNNGNIVFNYSIKGNQLTIAGNAGQVVYTRGTNNNTAATAGAKGIAMELVGKWCWVNVNTTNTGGSSSSRCIVLNADGTYTYEAERSMSVNTDAYYGGTSSQSSDRGTWYVQGDRIYYNSQSTGQGSYRLEKRNHPKNVNDPMIVLDGEAYVTATYRQPWR